MPRFIRIEAWASIAGTRDESSALGSNVMLERRYSSTASIACIVNAVTRTLLSWSSALSFVFTQ